MSSVRGCLLCCRALGQMFKNVKFPSQRTDAFLSFYVNMFRMEPLKRDVTDSDIKNKRTGKCARQGVRTVEYCGHYGFGLSR